MSKGGIKMSRFKKSCIYIFLLLLVVSSSKLALANESGAYKFPITTESKEWKEFSSKAEMVAACQIPEEMLSNMSTSDLVETVLNYPLLNSFWAFNSRELAYKTIYNDFNGFRELMSREDATEAILEKYKGIDVVSAEQADSVSSKEFLKPSAIEFLLVCDKVHNNFADEEYTNILEAVNQKETERQKEGIYSEKSAVYLDFVNPITVSNEVEYTTEPTPDDEFDATEDNAESSSDDIPEAVAGEKWTEVKGVKTPKGSEVGGVYKRSPDFTRKEKKEI